MKLIPAQIMNCDSNAEKKVFGFLSEITFGHYDLAIHSLNIGHHEYKRWGEADFFIIGRRGILLLEVKGGRVACENGVWKFKNRWEETTRKNEGPVEQAKSAFFSLEKNYLNPKFRSQLRGVPRGWAVVFTDIPAVKNDGSDPLPELPSEITAYDRDCLGHNSFKRFLNRAYDHWASKQHSPVALSPQTVSEITTSLRPNFERVPSLNSQLRDLEQKLYEFTEEQYEKLDAISENERILVTGGAGTGKTFVAAACARYEAASGRSVLFLTRSNFLASFLKSQAFPEGVEVSTIGDLENFVEQKRSWDVLVVDEGQDLCSFEYIDQIDRVLIGGWEDGRWRWFGDPNYQVSPSYPVEEDCFEYLKSHAVQTKLKNNIRNAAKIIDIIKDLLGADVGKAAARQDGGTVDLQLVKNEHEIFPNAISAVKKWLLSDRLLTRDKVALLVPEEEQVAEAIGLLKKEQIRAEALSERALKGKPRDCVLVSSIENFKGLERPLVCVAGLSERHGFAPSAYKAISRANHAVCLVATQGSVEQLYGRIGGDGEALGD